MKDNRTRLGEDLSAETISRREAWVAALRSGQFKQGVSVLRSKSDRYCCLGVASEVSGLGEWVEGIGVSYCYGYQVPATDGKTSWDDRVMPWAVGRYYELDEANPVLVLDGSVEQVSLASLNDHGPAGDPPFTFAQIADVIERYYLPIKEESSS